MKQNRPMSGLLWLMALSSLSGCALLTSLSKKSTPVATKVEDSRGFKILEMRCGPCHHKKGYPRINFRSKDALVAQGFVVAGSANRSWIYRKILANEMPPDRPLRASEKAAIRRSIDSLR